MKVWIASFLVLFALAEFFQWIKHFTLPLPVYILGGAFLAIASNYNRGAGFPFQKRDEPPTAIPYSTPTTSVAPSVTTPANSQLSQAPLTLQPRSPRPISFTISHPASQSPQSPTK